jgi:hypothetical protein
VASIDVWDVAILDLEFAGEMRKVRNVDAIKEDALAVGMTLNSNGVKEIAVRSGRQWW